MEKINKLLNILIVFIIIFVITFLVYNFIEPYIYNQNTTGKKITNYKMVEYLEGALNNYIGFYYNSDSESIKKCIIKNKIKSDDVYLKAIEDFKYKEYNEIHIKKIEKKINNVYIIYYYMNSNNEFCLEENLNKLIIKLKDSNNYFSVYYDSLCEEGV